MKTLKRMMALMITVMILMSMTIPAMADTTGGTITIGNAENGQSYSVYKMFDLSYDSKGTTDTADDAYSYYIKATDPWYAFLATGAGKDYVALTLVGDTYIVTWKVDEKAETVSAFAAAAKAYAENTAGVSAYDTKTASGDSVTLNTPDLGYYLVTTTVGYLVQLTTATPSVTLDTKNDSPTIEKHVKEDDTAADQNPYVAVNHSAAGKDLEYRITIHAANGAENYVLHDYMDEDHLQLVADSIKVYLNGTEAGNIVDAANYTVNTAPAETATHKDCTFEIAFKNDYLKTLDSDDDLFVTYTAKFAQSITQTNYKQITAAGHVNTAELSYGTGDKTVTAKTETTSFGMEITKYTTTLDHRLAGAVFELYYDEGCTEPVYVHYLGQEKVVDANGKEYMNDVYAVCNNTADGHRNDGDDPKAVAAAGKAGTLLETPEGSGTFVIYGLDMQKYWLKEIEAPAGYNPLDQAVVIDVTLDSVTTNRIYDINVENKTGSILPDTGGIGTTVFYVLGAVMVLGAVVLLITKKRMSTEK